MNAELKGIGLTNSQDGNCKFGQHIENHVRFLLDPSNKILMVNTAIVKSKFCANCGVPINA